MQMVSSVSSPRKTAYHMGAALGAPGCPQGASRRVLPENACHRLAMDRSWVPAEYHTPTTKRRERVHSQAHFMSGRQFSEKLTRKQVRHSWLMSLLTVVGDCSGVSLGKTLSLNSGWTGTLLDRLHIQRVSNLLHQTQKIFKQRTIIIYKVVLNKDMSHPILNYSPMGYELWNWTEQVRRWVIVYLSLQGVRGSQYVMQARLVVSYYLKNFWELHVDL